MMQVTIAETIKRKRPMGLKKGKVTKIGQITILPENWKLLNQIEMILNLKRNSTSK